MNLTEPTLLLDKKKCVANIRMMADKAAKNNVQFRPHFKTHQSHEIGRWFRDAGVKKIAVSSMKMAAYFAEDGWDDITVAFPVNVHEKERINRLAEKITLNLLVVSPENIDWLANEVRHNINLFIEVDTGQNRTGVKPTDTKLVDEILTKITQYEHFQFSGFLSHGGHSYKISGNRNKLVATFNEGVELMLPLKNKYKALFPQLIISPGDTPGCSVSDTFHGADEIRPGNFVFYDYSQSVIGSCSLNDIAVTMACPVVSVNPEKNEVVVHGGAVHLSKDFLIQPDGAVSFGKVVTLSENGWSVDETGMYVKSISQEHGVIHAEKEKASAIKIGDWLGVLPVHSCLTADVMKAYRTLGGEIITMMR